MDAEEIKSSLYPAWATDSDISIAMLDGYNNASSRPKGDWWQRCPREENQFRCDPGFQWNELACECFSMISCLIGCQMGHTLDPREACGECLTTNELFRDVYPLWATPMDVNQAFARMYGTEQQEKPSWKVCPIEDLNGKDCGEGKFWNELACTCFSFARCDAFCLDLDSEMDPRQDCECVDSQVLKDELYPDWATEDDIQKADAVGRFNYGESKPIGAMEKPSFWEPCPIYEEYPCKEP